MRSMIAVLLVTGIAVALASVAPGQWAIAAGLVLGSFAMACMIGTCMRWGLGSEREEGLR